LIDTGEFALRRNVRPAESLTNRFYWQTSPIAKEFGVKVIAYSPLGKGVLTGQFTKPSDFAEGDIRKTIPRFQEEHMESNLRIVREFEVLAKKKGCTSGQMALAWVISQGAIPIPGTRSSIRLEENFGATDVRLDVEDLKALRQLVEEAKPQGARWVHRIYPDPHVNGMSADESVSVNLGTTRLS
jgi:aryl-alcohol dehydrogenase-like predicted oxidoreductase